MFNKGEYIVHGRKGVCKIEDITYLDIDGADKKSLYYVLIPMKNQESKVFYPTNNDKIPMRAIHTKNQVEEIVEHINEIEPIWIDNERQREYKYKEVLGSCDCKQLIGIIKTLHKRGKSRLAHGKKITYVDEKYLREAKEVLYDEFSLALDMDKLQVEKYIIDNINESNTDTE